MYLGIASSVAVQSLSLWKDWNKLSADTPRREKWKMPLNRDIPLNSERKQDFGETGLTEQEVEQNISSHLIHSHVNAGPVESIDYVVYSGISTKKNSFLNGERSQTPRKTLRILHNSEKSNFMFDIRCCFCLKQVNKTLLWTSIAAKSK